ncbi:Dephospho-CoA kinase CAB5 [Erysiphe neolycopersici]|uniref:Dephospho-CoA kinase CAB5 n=1 Tax=Erysiphe neolycopersici TaxID=212602 RepID=A0A420HJS1_9PEZI|nr:Dephospho-CoA kinase CAB5 [Erysiphe neolycopersici]
MLILGLTGGIATGKSTVSEILSQAPYNVPIIDADILARRVISPGTRAFNKIVAHFSPTIPDLLIETLSGDNGSQVREGGGATLNRVALARCVFGNSKECRENRAVLNSIVHPAVRLEIIKEVLKKYICGHWIVVLDVPLLFESHLDLLCGAVLVVAVQDANIQMRRLQNRDVHLSTADAEARIQSQANLSTKVRKCLHRGKNNGMVIYNDGDFQELKREIQHLMSKFSISHPRWWTYILWFFPPFACLLGLWHLGRSWHLNRKWEQQEEQAKAKL